VVEIESAVDRAEAGADGSRGGDSKSKSPPCVRTERRHKDGPPSRFEMSGKGGPAPSALCCDSVRSGDKPCVVCWCRGGCIASKIVKVVEARNRTVIRWQRNICPCTSRKNKIVIDARCGDGVPEDFAV
jgi:hypothetical protein